MRKLHLSRHNVVSSWRTVVSLVQLKIAGGTLTYNNHVRDLNMAPRYVGLPKCTVVIYSARHGWLPKRRLILAMRIGSAKHHG